MPAFRLTDSIRRLLATQVDTFDKLELVVELASTPGQAVERTHLESGLSLTPDVFERSVAELERSGLLAARDGAVGPSGADAVRAMDELRRAYLSDGVAVVRALSEIAIARIHGRPARIFADAFVLRAKRRGEPEE